MVSPWTRGAGFVKPSGRGTEAGAVTLSPKCEALSIDAPVASAGYAPRDSVIVVSRSAFIGWSLLDSRYVGYVGEGARSHRAYRHHPSEYAGQYPKRNWGRHVLSERFRVEIRDPVRTGFRLYRPP